MKVNLWVLLFFLLSSSLHGQYTVASYTGNAFASVYTESVIPERPPYAKLYQRNYGAIIGIQKGKATSFEFGGEAHWRKLSLMKPRITGATANIEYDFRDHVIGYKAGIWTKRGRVNLTYGANLVYFTDFNGGSKYGGGPSVGFRLLGFHLINGVNFLAGDEELKANTLYISLRYYFPVENKFTWDKKTKKKKEREKKQRLKAREKKRKEREKRREENPSLLDRIKKPFEKA